ncbi:MAG: hypothetical protein AB3N17_12785 [Tateyamaria sp.]
MGTTLAVISLIGGVVAIIAIELLASGDKSALYRAVMIGVGILSLIALAISVFFSSGGVNGLGAVLAVVGLIAVGVFYTFGDSKPVVQSKSETQSGSDDQQG